MVPSEEAALRWFQDRGAEVLWTGWPDFLVNDDNSGEWTAFEVKMAGDGLRPAQLKMMGSLAEAGIPTGVIRMEKTPHGFKVAGMEDHMDAALMAWAGLI